MAEALAPPPRSSSWLDRPLAARWQRLLAVVDWELAAYSALVLIGFVLRIWDVGSRAMHHDESLHAYYSWQFYDGRGYTYDPLTHGPFQFELVAVFYLLFGDNDTSARLLAVLLGTVLIALPYFLRRYLTAPGALLTSLMLAISPAFVYFSRFIRDDMYLACFTLLIFVCLARYLDAPRPRWLYIAAAAAAMAMASMEAAYMEFFIFATFLLFQGIREWLTEPGPVLRALRATSLDTWLTAAAIFVVLTVLFYSTFFTNPYGIWDTRHSFLSPDRKDILGGLTYWKAQQYVQRGGQPWFYYLLTLSLYEQLALLFGCAGLVLSFFQRSLFRTFLVWWAVFSYGLFTWAGEKMPWLTIHIALPLIVLAGLFLGNVLSWSRIRLAMGVGVLFLILLFVEIHSMFALNYVDGANPTEMMVYVQTAQDVPNVVHEMASLPGWPNVTVGLDDADVGGWPFTWYLRHDNAVTETSVFDGPTCGGQYCQVLLMLGPEYDKYGGKMASRYVAQKYRWNWWFPEDYKVWFPEHWGKFWSGQGGLSDLVGTPADWSNIWNWLVYRTPFGDRGARDLYVLVRRDLVAGASYFPKRSLAGGTSQVAPTVPQLPYTVAETLNGGAPPLAGPRGIASDAKGNVYVADTLNHRIVVFDPSGKMVRAWGTAGAGPGQFSSRDSPQGVAVGPDGRIYAVDTWNQRVEVFTAGGRFVRQWGGGTIGSQPGQFFGPRSIAVGSNGKVYVADTGNKRIQVFSPTGTYLFSIGSAGSGTGQFNEPSAVAIGPNGNVYVADFWNQRIQVFSASGAFIRSWQVTDWVPQTYDEPFIAIVPSTGDVLASDPQQNQVLEFSSTGGLLGAVREPSLSMPIGVASPPGGRVAVSYPNANRVNVFTQAAGQARNRHTISPIGRVTRPVPKRP